MSETNDMRQMTGMGRMIENSSFDVIDSEIGFHDFNEQEYEIVRRVIHSTADFEYKFLMKFSEGAIETGINALMNGCNIIADVKMITVGLNADRLGAYNCDTYSFISDEDVIETAKANNTTRALESIRKAHKLGLLENSIVAVGNTPTALLEVLKIYRETGVKPALIIGVPVGFISAAESKEEAILEDIPYIISRGRKGGSTIAVSIIHALLLLSTKR